jgi:Lar family restriction alleviation protein
MSKIMVLEKAFDNWDKKRKKPELPIISNNEHYPTDCPFCGSIQTRIVDTSLKYERDVYWRVKCDSCGAYGPAVSKNMYKRDDAIILWNNRSK